MVDFLYSLGLDLVAPSVGNMCMKTRQVVYKNLCIHFMHLWIFTKILMHNYILMWKITTTMKINIIWIIQYFSLKFILGRFCIWKITKKSHWVLCPKVSTPTTNVPSYKKNFFFWHVCKLPSIDHHSSNKLYQDQNLINIV